MKTPTATRPLEYVCLYPVEMPTQEGDVYVYIAVDGYSHYMFQTGVEKDNSAKSVLKHLKLLVDHPNFLKHRDKGFTIVLHKYQQITDQINEVIVPLGGKVIFNDPYLTTIIGPAIEYLFSSLPKGVK